jgi:hypothetical protein
LPFQDQSRQGTGVFGSQVGTEPLISEYPLVNGAQEHLEVHYIQVVTNPRVSTGPMSRGRKVLEANGC